MANLSDASGTVRFYTSRERSDKIVDLIDEIERRSEFFFGIEKTSATSGPTYWEYTFSGTGRWNMETNISCFNAWYLIPDRYDTADIISAKHALRKELKEVDEIYFDYIDYEPGMCLFIEETVDLSLKDGLVNNTATSIEEIALTAENRNGYGLEEGCLDSSCWSLRNLDIDSIPKKYKEILESMNEAEIDAVGVHAGLDLYGNSDYYESTSDFWEEWGEAIAGTLDEFTANGRVL